MTKTVLSESDLAYSDEDVFVSSNSYMPLKQMTHLLHGVLKYFSGIDHPLNLGSSTKDRICHRHRSCNGGKEQKTPRGVRIKIRIVMAAIIICLNRNTGLAFSPKGVTRRRSRCIPNIISRMKQDGDGTYETPDDKKEIGSNESEGKGRPNPSNNQFEELEKEYTKRITRLEDIVSRQEVEIHRLKNTCAELSEVSQAFGQLLKLLREAGLDADSLEPENNESEGRRKIQEDDVPSKNKLETSLETVIESYDDALIFGTAPNSVIDAADGAGAAILAAMLGGKQRMLVDVRDAELSSDPEILVQFIELAILPIAAGLEGLKSTRNRVKIVFPKVSQLLEYRRTMALAAPEVVALSTLGFDPVEKRDKLVVIVAPEPDDEEGIQAIRDLLTPSEEGSQPIQQPVVILNYHMVPFQGVNLNFETAYHLRLLAVQYMAANKAEESSKQQKISNDIVEADKVREDNGEVIEDATVGDNEEKDIDDEALWVSAMKHAHEVGVNEGITRAMVIRAYPRPWHIFVDLSPDTNADFEVAATFDKEPSTEELNFAIVECLEGSEREDEIVAQQMQQALEDGQLNQVSDMISDSLDKYLRNSEDDSSLDDDEDDDFDMFEEDSV